MPIIPEMEGSLNRRRRIQADLSKRQDPVYKISREKQAEAVVQVVELLPSSAKP
jgi:hypothetical protein